MKRLIIWTAGALAATSVAAAGYSDYVKDGLVALYDAEFNSTNAEGVAVHDANATEWVNLVAAGEGIPGALALPSGAYAIGAKAITLTKKVATATGCTVAATNTGPITLEACCRRSSGEYNYEMPLVSLVNRAMGGFYGYNSRTFWIAVPNQTNLASSKQKNIYLGPWSWSYNSYRDTVRAYSFVCPIDGGNVVAGGLDAGTAIATGTGSAMTNPNGTVRVGNVNIAVAYNSVRIYNRELTMAERQHNNAVDAFRFADATTAPWAKTKDADGDVVDGEEATAAGTVAVTAGEKAKGLANAATSGTVTFDATASGSTKDDPVKYLMFDAAANSTTVFRGGWWDFSSGAFLTSDQGSRTVTLEEGAQFANVGAVTLAQFLGKDNLLRLTGASSLSAASMAFGTLDGEQRNRCEVLGGSSLAVSGEVRLSDSLSSYTGNTRTKNNLTVAGEGSSLTVGGITSLGQVTTYPNASSGGNFLYVTNGATASLQTLRIACGCAFGGGNTVVFADRARVTMTQFDLNDSWSSSDGRTGTNRVLVDSGAVVTNTGYFSLGYGSTHNSAADYNEFVVSNAEFYTTGGGYEASGVTYMIDGKRTTLRIAGKDAKVTIGCRTSSWSLFHGAGSSFILEDGAQYTLRSGSFNYTVGTSDETILVRTGAKLTVPDGISTCGGARNRVRIESDGEIALSSGTVNITGTDAELIVDNGTLRVSNDLTVGSASGKTAGTASRMTLRGTRPFARPIYNMAVYSNACLRIELPAGGYDEGYATSAKPLLDVGWASSEKTLRIYDYGKFEITGVGELQANCREKHEYVLVQTNLSGLKLPTGMLANLQAAVKAEAPHGAKLYTRQKNFKTELVLKVYPCGTCIYLK